MHIQSHFNSIEGRISQSLGVTRPVPVAFKLLARCHGRINLEHWQLRIGSDSEPSLQVIIYLFKSLFIVFIYFFIFRVRRPE